MSDTYNGLHTVAGSFTDHRSTLEPIDLVSRSAGNVQTHTLYYACTTFNELQGSPYDIDEVLTMRISHAHYYLSSTCVPTGTSAKRSLHSAFVGMPQCIQFGWIVGNLILSYSRYFRGQLHNFSSIHARHQHIYIFLLCSPGEFYVRHDALHRNFNMINGYVYFFFLSGPKLPSIVTKFAIRP